MGWTQFWHRWLWPVASAPVAAAQGLLFSRAEGRRRYRELKSLAPDLEAIASRMREWGWEWTGDPWSGRLDFYQNPRVTCARGKGDCDDWAHLWKSLLRHHGRVDLLYAQSEGGEGHLMCVFTAGGHSTLLSNLEVSRTVPESMKDTLLMVYYGDRTRRAFFY